MNLSSLITDFLEYLEIERNTSQKTIENYDHYLKRFLNFAGDINPSAIDLSLIRKYRLHLGRWTDPKTKQPLKRITQNYFMIALRSFLRYLARRDIETLSPEKIELGETEASPIKVLDADALVRLLGAPDIKDKSGLRDRAILETLFSTGLRVSELCSLDRNKIDTTRGELSIRGKGSKIRVVFLSDSAALWLERYVKTREDTIPALFIRYAGRIPEEGKEDEALARITELQERVEAGEDFTELARKYSEEPNAVNGGELGIFGRYGMDENFTKVAFSTPVGQVSGPVLTKFGYHIILVEDKFPEEVARFDEIKEQLKSAIEGEKRNQIFLIYITQLKAQSNVEIYLEE